MFKIILCKLKELFNPTSINLHQLLMSDADMLMKRIKQSNKLSELLVVKQQLKEYRDVVERHDVPREVKNKLVFLEAQWNKQFRIWRTRG